MVNGSVLNSGLILRIENEINNIFSRALNNPNEDREQIIVDGFAKDILISDVSLYRKLVEIKRKLAFQVEDISVVYQFNTFALKKGNLDANFVDANLSSFIDNVRSVLFDNSGLFDDVRKEFDSYGLIPGIDNISPRPMLKDEDINKYESYLRSFYNRYLNANSRVDTFRPPYPNELFAWRNGGMVQLDSPNAYYQKAKSMFEAGELKENAFGSSIVVGASSSPADEISKFLDDDSDVKIYNNDVIDYSTLQEKELFKALDSSSKDNEDFIIKESKPTVGELLEKIRDYNAKLCFLESASEDRSVDIEEIKKSMQESLGQVIETHNLNKNDDEVIGFTMV